MGIDEAPDIAEVQPVGEGTWRIGGSAERAFEAPARIGERAQHDNGIERLQQRLATARIGGRLAGRGRREVHGIEGSGRVGVTLRDLSAADQDRRALVVHATLPLSPSRLTTVTANATANSIPIVRFTQRVSVARTGPATPCRTRA